MDILSGIFMDILHTNTFHIGISAAIVTLVHSWMLSLCKCVIVINFLAIFREIEDMTAYQIENEQ